MMPITDTVPASVYENYTQSQIQADLVSGTMPITFTRRMRLLNLLSGVTLNKIPVPYIKPFKVLDIHHALNDGDSAENIISQLNSSAMFAALAVGDITPLWEEAQTDQKLKTSFTQGWTPRFFEEPFSPINVMLAMRSKLLLEVVDELGHSYELLKSLGLGFIPDEDMEGWPPGGIDDTIPDILDDPIDPPADADPGDPWYEPPEEGEPGYVPPVEGEPGYVPPVEGEPGYVPPIDGEPGTGEPGTGEPGGGEPGAGEPGAGEPGGGEPGPGAGPGEGPGEGPGTGPGPGSVPGTLLFGSEPGGGSYTGFGDAYGPLGSGGRSPGAPSGGGGGVDCCIGSDDETVFLEAEASEVGLGDTVAVNIANLVEGCDADNYCFEITEGTGTLNLDEDDFLESYTAPDTNPEGANDPTIALYCNDEIVDELALTLVDWCVGDDENPVSIEYTTLYMEESEYQEISLTNLKAAAPVSAFTFGISSGTGTLSFDAEGWMIGYTSPPTNPSCENNPTIFVLCNGAPLDSITINVNLAPLLGVVFYQCEPRPSPTCAQIAGYDGSCYRQGFCSGNYVNPAGNDSFCECIGWGPDPPNAAASSWQTCAQRGYEIGTIDLRTPEQLAQGCCPPQLF